MNALADDEDDGNAARARLRADPSLHAPHLMDLEVLSVLRRQAGRGSLSARRVNLAIQDLMDLPLIRYPHLALAWRIWELRFALTSYDAAYVALAETLECSVVTADARLASASGLRCQVEVLGPA